eukprot:1159033-Pelagomonas_calceolata.AAC.3
MAQAIAHVWALQQVHRMLCQARRGTSWWPHAFWTPGTILCTHELKAHLHTQARTTRVRSCTPGAGRSVPLSFNNALQGVLIKGAECAGAYAVSTQHMPQLIMCAHP